MQLLLKVPGRKAPPLHSTVRYITATAHGAAMEGKFLGHIFNPKHINGESKMLEGGGHSMPENPERYTYKRVELRKSCDLQHHLIYK